MEITDLTLKILLIITPGILGMLITRYLTTHKEFSAFYFLIYSWIFGFSIYGFMELGSIGIHYYENGNFDSYKIPSLKIWLSLVNNGALETKEILLAIVISIPAGFLLSFLLQHKLLIRFAQFSTISNRFGDDDVWNFILNSKNIDWIYLRDYTNSLVYRGQIQAFSDPDKKKEVLLYNVTVYGLQNSVEYYSMQAVYLDLTEIKFSLEIPNFTNNGVTKWQKKLKTFRNKVFGKLILMAVLKQMFDKLLPKVVLKQMFGLLAQIHLRHPRRHKILKDRKK
jgi:hypothetical protein